MWRVGERRLITWEVVVGFKLSGDQLKTALRRLGEVQRQLGQDSGYPYHSESMLQMLQCLTEGRFFPLPEDLIAHKHGLEIVTSVPSFDLSQGIKLVPFLRDGEKKCSSEQMRARALELDANLGLWHAEFLRIRVGLLGTGWEWVQRFIIFAGTLLRNRGGRHFIPCLYLNDTGWTLLFHRMEEDFCFRSGVQYFLAALR